MSLSNIPSTRMFFSFIGEMSETLNPKASLRSLSVRILLGLEATDTFEASLKNPKKVKNEVAEFRKEFQEIKYCFQTPNKAYEYLKFY